MLFPAKIRAMRLGSGGTTAQWMCERCSWCLCYMVKANDRLALLRAGISLIPWWSGQRYRFRMTTGTSRVPDIGAHVFGQRQVQLYLPHKFQPFSAPTCLLGPSVLRNVQASTPRHHQPVSLNHEYICVSRAFQVCRAQYHAAPSPAQSLASPESP